MKGLLDSSRPRPFVDRVAISLPQTRTRDVLAVDIVAVRSGGRVEGEAGLLRVDPAAHRRNRVHNPLSDGLEAEQVTRGHVFLVARLADHRTSASGRSGEPLTMVDGLGGRVAPRVQDELGVGGHIGEAVDALGLEQLLDVRGLGLAKG